MSEVKDMTKREREYWFRCALDGKGNRAKLVAGEEEPDV